MAIKKIISSIIVMLFSNLTTFGQCTGQVVDFFPATINGVTVTQTYTGSVWCCGPPYTSCGVTSGRIYLGGNSPTVFVQKLSFSTPVNNIIYIITGSDSSGSGIESFNFTVDAGVLTATQYSVGCLYNQSGNVFSANIYGNTGNNAYIILTSSLPYNSITVSGPGGNNGSIMGLCSSLINGISPFDPGPFSLYPNPSIDGIFTVDYLLPVEAVFEIFDVNGILVGRYDLSSAKDKIEVRNEKLGAGIYLYKIIGSNAILKSGKIVVIK